MTIPQNYTKICMLLEDDVHDVSAKHEIERIISFVPIILHYCNLIKCMKIIINE